MALFPPSLVFLSLRWSSISRENSLSRGGCFGTPSGGLAFAERWVTYLEWKTEVEEVSTVAWPLTLVPLPRLWGIFAAGDRLCFNSLLRWF